LRTIAREIHEADADYVLALKANHEVLHEEIQSFLDDALDHPAHLPAASRHQSVEKGPRKDRNAALPLRRPARLAERGWAMGRRAQRRRRRSRAHRRRKDHARTALLPQQPAARGPALARAIRRHRGIENSLHWVLDVAMNEDQCRVRTGHAATNLATLRHLALNLLRQDTTKKRGIRTKQKIAAWDHR
jgi:predicted transposase YbfD/YdcC